jgi:MSHA pilin protein MshC
MTHATMRGFTLVELVMVMIVTGVLAVAVIPRFFNRQDFQDKGFYDETLAILRYGQKAAIVQRRSVCVTFTGTTVTLRIAANPSPATCVTGTPDASTVNLVSPTGASPFVVTAKGSAAFSLVPANFKFNALGQPLAANDALLGAAQTFTVSQVGNIMVEAETGYVHP